MSQQTRQEVLARLRHFYKSAGRKHKSKLIQEAIALLGYHPKAAIRALNNRAAKKPKGGVPAVIGRPREFAPDKLLPLIKPIWFAALQPCGKRLQALLPEWLPAYEADHRRIDADAGPIAREMGDIFLYGILGGRNESGAATRQ